MRHYIRIFFYDIMNLIIRYLPACLLTAALLEAITIVILIIRKKKIHFMNIVWSYLFWTYITAVFFITLLSREPGSRGGMSWELFSTWGTTEVSHAFVLENIILFIPFGFLFPLVFPPARRIRVLILTALIYSVCIEFTQVITQMGYGQIDDIVTNVLGAGIGYNIWLLIFQDQYLKPVSHHD